MTTHEMSQKRPDGEYEDLCSTCLSIVYNIDEPEERAYLFQNLSEGLTYCGDSGSDND